MKKKIVIALVATLIAISCSACHLSHKWVAATCTSPKFCEKCGETVGEALGHDWMAADCLSPKTCSRCGAEVGEALGHDWIEADCTKARTCRRCGVTEGEPLDHIWKDADCGTPKTCENCGTTEGKPLGHDVTSWYLKQQATCTKEGIETGMCNRCKKTVEREIKRKGHTPGEWQITKQATSSENGLRIRKCIVCGEQIDSEIIKAKKNEPSHTSNSHTSNSHTSNNRSTYSPGRERDAWICAQDIVKRNLKAPATAKFCKSYEATVTYLSGSDYKVEGFVDAENGFGANIRTYFTVTLTLTKEGYKNGIATFN